ncbi:hypothetical protein V6N13_038119 [Hibiscus sabdariffa]
MARSFPALPLPSDDDNRDPKKPRRQDEEPPDTGGTMQEPMDTDAHLGATNPPAAYTSHANPNLHANNIIPLPPFDPYGPWMVVDRRHLRPPKNPIASTERPLENLHAGSRFDPLLADQNENIGPVQNQSATPSVSPAPPIDPTPDYNEPLPKARMLST